MGGGAQCTAAFDTLSATHARLHTTPPLPSCALLTPGPWLTPGLLTPGPWLARIRLAGWLGNNLGGGDHQDCPGSQAGYE